MLGAANQPPSADEPSVPILQKERLRRNSVCDVRVFSFQEEVGK
jgi:hypothetical protein